MSGEPKQSEFSLRPTQWLGAPRIIAPPKKGHRSAAVLFVIPGLRVSQRDRPAFAAIAKACGLDVFDTALEHGKARFGDQVATLVSIAFYVEERASEEETKQRVDNVGRLLLERFMGCLSFLSGMRLSAAAAQTVVVSDDGHFSSKLEAQSKMPELRHKISISELPFDGKTPSDELFSSMFWLRRGLAERDSLETYGALMNALQCLARELVHVEPVETTCKNCGHIQGTQEPSITSLVRELVVAHLGRPKELFTRLWKARNAISAHGNRTVTPDVFLELIELKYEAINLCFEGISLALGVPADSQPHPHQALFVGSAMMYVD